MKILVLDNYDSFTYNLVHIVKELGYNEQMDIYRNDKINIEDVQAYDKILLSPGPGIPSEAGKMPEIIQEYAPKKSILGVCLGYQGIGEAFGAQMYNMEEVLHGVAKKVSVLEDDSLFKDMPKQFVGCRYHSWILTEESIGGDLKIIAKDEDGLVMGIAHQRYDVKGLQFHPESILTEHGKTMINNWLQS